MQSTNATEIIDSAKLNRTHYLLVFWCSFIMMLGGYDLVIYGSVLSHLMTDWNLTPQEAGMLGSSSMIGMMCGAFLLGTLADRLGRRNIIVFCVALFSIAVFANAFVQDAWSFAICRFLTGLGLGGVVPNLVTLIKEMAPAHCRNRLINLMLAFFPVGGLLSGLAGIYMIPSLGWHSPFYVAGLSLLALPFIYYTLPESVAYLVQRKRFKEAAKILPRLNREFTPVANETYVLTASSSNGGSGMSSLFANGQAFSTAMLWATFCMTMLMVYGLNTWLPKLMTAGGYPLGSSISFLVTMNIGALIGTLVSGVIADRWGCKPTLAVFFAIAAVSISLLGTKPDAYLLYTLLLLAGGSSVGCLSVVHTLAADLYPAASRSTGVSMAAAVGRSGAVIGPILGGYLYALALQFEINFIIFAVPGVIAVFTVLMVARTKKENFSNPELYPARSQDL